MNFSLNKRFQRISICLFIPSDLCEQFVSDEGIPLQKLFAETYDELVIRFFDLLASKVLEKFKKVMLNLCYFFSFHRGVESVT